MEFEPTEQEYADAQLAFEDDLRPRELARLYAEIRVLREQLGATLVMNGELKSQLQTTSKAAHFHNERAGQAEARVAELEEAEARLKRALTAVLTTQDPVEEEEWDDHRAALKLATAALFTSKKEDKS